MNFIFDFIAWYWPIIHKVDWFFIVVPILGWAAFAGLNATALKHILCIIGYTVTLNVFTVLLGFSPSWWWAWGWNFAFIPVFNWPKVMTAIFTVTFITLIVMYNTNWKKELDKYAIQGFSIEDDRCSNWPCTEFNRSGSYAKDAQLREEKKAAEKAAREAQTRPATAPKAAPTTNIPDSGLPALMYVPVK